MQILQPPNWPKPKGYSNGTVAEGKVIFLAGLVGWDETETIVSDNFVDQVRQALKNIVSVLAEADATPANITRMTWYVTDKDEYLDSLKNIGSVYQEVIGIHYPAMALIQIAGLVEEGAKLEIEATAVIPKEEM